MDTEKKQSRANLATFLLLLAIVLPINAKLIAPYALALFMGAILALISTPAYDKLRSRGWKPRWAALVVTLAGLVLIIAPVSIFLTKALQQGAVVAQDLSQSQEFSLEALTSRLKRWGPTAELIGRGPELEQQLRSGLQTAGKAASGLVLKIFASVPMAAIQLAMAFLGWYFMLRDGRRLTAWVIDKLPLDQDVSDKLVESLSGTAVSTVWATLSAAAVQACVLAAGFALLGVPGVFLAWGATFILSWFPMVGSIPVTITGMGWLYFQGDYAKVGLMAGVGVLVTLVDNVVRPMVLKGREEMHPFVALMAVIAGIDQFGILGAFIGPVLVAVAISLLNLWPVAAHRFGFSLDPAPSAAAVLTGPVPQTATDSNRPAGGRRGLLSRLRGFVRRPKAPR